MTNWAIVEEDSFNRAVAQLGGAWKVDRALAPIMGGIEGNPLAFPEIPGLKNVHIGRTKLVMRDLEIIPAMRVWFRVSAEYNSVYMLYVEIAPPEDMGFGNNLWDPDEEPFW